MIRKLAIANYRSLRDLVIPLGNLTVVTGPNGSGKSNLYKSLRLISESANNTAVAAIAREGGLSSILWAGPEKFSKSVRTGTHPVEGTQRMDRVHLRLGFCTDEYGYAIDYGMTNRPPGTTMFFRDAEIKREVMWRGSDLWHARRAILDRRVGVFQSRDDEGKMHVVLPALSLNESVLGSLIEPYKYPELFELRQQIGGWRFHDSFRIDVDSPIRNPQIGTFAPVLADDGSNLASVWQTIVEIGDAESLSKHLQDAFPKSSVQILESEGKFELRFKQHGLLRALHQTELSDGTLRYLYWLTALLSPRPPTFLVLNEPETSIHADLLPALGRLIVAASANTQIWVVSHSQQLTDALMDSGKCTSIRLTKEMSETLVQDQSMFDRPGWRWPSR